MTLIIILHVVICVFLVGVILLQPGKSDSGIGFGSTSQSIFGSRGAGNLLTRTTAIAAVLFLTTSFFLARERMSETGGSVIKGAPEAPADATQTPPPAATTDAKPADKAAASPAAPPAPSKDASKK